MNGNGILFLYWATILWGGGGGGGYYLKKSLKIPKGNQNP